MYQFHALNPYRSPSWRWERARIMRDGKLKRIHRHTDDKWLRKAYRFQIDLSRCNDDTQRFELMDEFPEIYGAYLVYQRGDMDDRNPLRYAIEARLLSGQDFQEIADRAGVSKLLIEAYESLFFNVIEKLQNSDYIMTCVIGPAVHAGLTDRDYDLLWKLFGYIYGPLALDSFISTSSGIHRPETLAEVDATLAEDTRSSLQRKVAVVARTYQLNPFSQSELLNIYARLLEMEKDTGASSNRDVILQNVQVMMEKLPVQIGSSRSTGQHEILNKYDASGIDLHTDELLAATADQDIVDARLLNAKFPEKKKNEQPPK